MTGSRLRLNVGMQNFSEQFTALSSADNILSKRSVNVKYSFCCSTCQIFEQSKFSGHWLFLSPAGHADRGKCVCEIVYSTVLLD